MMRHVLSTKTHAPGFELGLERGQALCLVLHRLPLGLYGLAL